MSGYPLQWPAGWPRASSRKDAAFTSYKRQLSVDDGLKRVFGELELFKVQRDDVIVSTNIRPRLDGLPRSDGPAPADPGVAVYWQTETARRVMAIDRYTRVADNLAAIAATLESLRAIERHGGGQVLDRAFTGFAALSAPDHWERLGLRPGASELEIRARFRELVLVAHPDVGGSQEQFTRLVAARDAALAELAR